MAHPQTIFWRDGPRILAYVRRMANASVNHVSDTALWVATYRALESERPDAAFRDPLADRLVGERGREIARAMPYGKMTAWIMVVRTVAIDRLIFEAIAEGVDTVVNLGAGLDTRPYRLDLPATLRWIEVDFPEMIAMKSARLTGETPRCQLEQIGLDLSVRPDAQRLCREIGARTGKVLVITEGVVPYLTVEQATHLAEDLRSVTAFRYWIQDYRKRIEGWNEPKKLREKLANAPFRFDHPDPLALFASHGWRVKHDVLASEEGERLGRKFPMPLMGYLFMPFVPKAKREAFRRMSGFVLLEAG